MQLAYQKRVHNAKTLEITDLYGIEIVSAVIIFTVFKNKRNIEMASSYLITMIRQNTQDVHINPNQIVDKYFIF